MKLSERYVALVVALILVAVPAIAKVDFSGDWKLNTGKSDFGQMPPPNSMTLKITHEDPKLTIASKQSSDRGDFEYTANYSTDGKETTNEMRGNTSKSTAKWDGDAVVIDTKASFNGNDVNIQNRMSLSSDGKTLTQKRKFSSSQGDMEQTLVFEKQ